MTIKIGYSGSSKKTEVEVILCVAGLETERQRIKDGEDRCFGGGGSQTFVVREVAADVPVELAQGAQRHGNLNPPAPGHVAADQVVVGAETEGGEA